ncbi:MAG: translation initiation factor IF-2 N-terminal domain-containing protein, partial [Sedimentisphaerales bacterium]|nr:translation initiation factor IF-2 N-terminal domain-containing protein [Sedimentisphaerales bacterium]
MARTRVHILAKELGVKSSAIIKKCRDEGIEIKNHMSVISAGLAATIREWFSEAENVTTVETGQKVDLEKARVRPKKPKEQVPEEGPTGPQVQPTATEEIVEEPQVAEVPPSQPVVTEAPAQVQEVLQPAALAPEPQVASVEPPPPPPPPPEPIKPAGPMLERPSPAKLQGPTVVRVEPPEPIRPFRPRPRPTRNVVVTQPLVPSGLLDAKAKKAVPKKVKGRVDDAVGPEDDGATVVKSKLKWRQRDLEERQARLEAIGGEGLRIRPSRKIQTKAAQPAQPSQPRPKKVSTAEPIVVKDLAAALGVKVSDVISKLLELGTMATANQVVSKEVAELLALAFEMELVVERPKSILDQIREEFDNRPR